METQEKPGSRNLGDFLRIKQDDTQSNPGPITDPNSHSGSVTLNSILSDKTGQIHQQPPRVHSNRTLADIIRDESSAAAKTDGKRTWQLFKYKLRHHASSPTHRDRAAGTSEPESTRVPDPVESTRPETRPGVAIEHTSSLAMRLQSEINDDDEDDDVEVEGNIPARTSLMALLAETDRQMGLVVDDGSDFLMDGQDLVVEESVVVGYNSCCVCMVRHKGAAFIPCGHTFCRLCSRELWVQRGSCPLCNNCIVEILDIF